MMYRTFLLRPLLTLIAVAFFVPATLRAQDAQPSDDDMIRSACVMVKAHIVRRGQQPIASATGTGFFVASDLILTCNHCTRIPMPQGMVNANDVRVELDGGRFVSAKVIARDAAHDLALLQISEKDASQSGCRPLSVSRFSLNSGSPITIVGNFPEAIRLTRGQLVTRSVMSGFAMGNAKVRSGFSGGPVLTPDGKVQGILSQRDDDNNSIFVRSDVILSMLKRYGRPVAPAPAADESAEQAVASAPAERDSAPAAADGAQFQPASKTSAPESAPQSNAFREKSAEASSMVIALPVRPAGR